MREWGGGQTLGSGNLLAFTSAAALREAFPLAADLRMLADFAFCAAEHPGTVLLDAPPTMARAPPWHPLTQSISAGHWRRLTRRTWVQVNHSSSADGANTAFRFDGPEKVPLPTQ